VVSWFLGSSLGIMLSIGEFNIYNHWIMHNWLVVEKKFGLDVYSYWVLLLLSLVSTELVMLSSLMGCITSFPLS
jgi:hypothetical protein